MNGINTTDRSGTALPRVAAAPFPHAAAHRARREHDARFWQAEAVTTAGALLRVRGDVYPVAGARPGIAAVAATEPVSTDDKCTGASVPGRRGST